MKLEAGQAAVVTGAASGIGFELSRALGLSGLKVVMADIDEGALAEAASALKEEGIVTIRVVTDVSNTNDIDALAKKTMEAFGAVNVLCNNAGIFCKPRFLWEQPEETWRKTFGVNVDSVISGIQKFVPIILDQSGPAHIVNVSSVAGHQSQPFLGPYVASKFAVTALTEALFFELQSLNSKIGVSLLSPGFTKTNILKAVDSVGTGAIGDKSAAFSATIEKAHLEGLAAGATPQDVARMTLEAIEENRFYVFPSPHTKTYIKDRFDGVIAEKNPVLSEKVRERFRSEK